jgi:hypothetical protein
MKLGKVKKRQYYIVPTDEWIELIPLNEISQSKKNNIIST